MRSDAVCPLMVTRTSEPMGSIKPLLILTERGYGDDSRTVVMRENSRQVRGVNRQTESPFRAVRGDVPQKFFSIASQEVSISRSVPHGEARNREALFVVGEQVFGDVLKVLKGELPTMSVAVVGGSKLIVGLMEISQVQVFVYSAV